MFDRQVAITSAALSLDNEPWIRFNCLKRFTISQQELKCFCLLTVKSKGLPTPSGSGSVSVTIRIHCDAWKLDQHNKFIQCKFVFLYFMSSCSDKINLFEPMNLNQEIQQRLNLYNNR